MIQLTRAAVFRWARSDVTEAGKRFFDSGAVQGSQRKGDLIVGSLKIGAARFVTQVTLQEGGAQVQCHCAMARNKGVCAHAIAVALDWLKRNQPQEEEVVFNAEHAPTLKQVEAWADPQVLVRAMRMVKSGDVTRVAFRYPEGKAVVQANLAELPVSFMMLPNGLARGKCPCAQSRDYGKLCEHIVATMVAVMHVYGNDERRAQYEADRQQMNRLAHAKGLIQRAPGGVPAKVRVFLADLNALKQQFEHGEVKVMVRLFVEEKAYTPQQLPPRAYAFSDADDALIGIFEDVAGGAFKDVLTLSATDFLAVLRCSERSWVGFVTTRQQLRFYTKPIVTPLMVRPNLEADALEVSVQLPAHAIPFVRGVQGYVVAGTQIAPLHATLPTPLQSLYQQPVSIPRDGFATFFKKELPLLTATLPLDDESVTFDLFTTTPATPKFCLELEGTEISILGKLSVIYGERRLTVGDTQEITLPDPDDFYHCYVRNREAEAEALERTRGLGFDGCVGKHLGVIDGARAILNLLGEHIPALRRDGWRVELRGSIQERFDQAEMIVPVVKVASNADGTFELTTSYDAPAGKLHIEARDVERALAYRNAYIEKDGQIAFVDLDALRTLRETLTSCRARAGATPGSLCVDAVHAPFIEASLANLEGIDFETHPDWRKRAAQQNREQMPEAVDLGPLENTLRPYQKEGVYWLRFLETCGFCGILADEMGLGKTLQTLTWLQLTRVREQAQRLPALIVCPTSLVENWRREALKFVPWLKCLVLSGPARVKDFASVPQMNLVITSYALIRRDTDFHSRCRYGTVVLDEAQAIKNQRTQNALAVKQLQADTRLVLSGTPIENGVSDLWSIMDFLMPDYLGKYEDFKVRYEDAVAFGGRMAEQAQAQLRRRLHPFLLRRVKKDVAPDLPDKIRSVMYCELTDVQRRTYDKIRDRVRSRMRNLVKEKGFERSRFEVLADLMRLRQICDDAALLKDDAPQTTEKTSAKLDALMELLAEARAGGHRMLVFSQFTSMLKRIAARLEEEGIRFCYLDGSTKHRLEACTQFNQDVGISAFLISLKAGGTGLNLTGADMVVHVDPWWNPAAEEQATDRAHRIGQKKTVQVIKMIAQDTIEEKVLELQKKKRALIEATVNASDDSIVSTLTLAEIEDLLA